VDLVSRAGASLAGIRKTRKEPIILEKKNAKRKKKLEFLVYTQRRERVYPTRK